MPRCDPGALTDGEHSSAWRVQLAGLPATKPGAMAWKQGSSLLELLEAPAHLLYLSSVLGPCMAQLLQEMLVGADQGAGGGKESYSMLSPWAVHSLLWCPNCQSLARSPPA